MRLGERIQTGDWKAEKHVPVIESPDSVAPDKLFAVKVSVGREIPHPNTTEHHIRWIDVYFQPEGDKFLYHVGHFEFAAHGEAVKGTNPGPVYANPDAQFSMKINVPGTLIAVSLCNIHGLWESFKEVKLE